MNDVRAFNRILDVDAVLSGVFLNDLAYELWEARRLGHTIDATRNDLPKTKAEAYEVQEAIVELSELPRCGYKVGSTSKEAQRLLSTDEPGLGVLLAPFVHESPARINIVPEQMPAVEGEFVFRIGRDLPWRTEQYTLAEIADAIDGVTGAIEVVGTRFSGGLEGKGRLLTTADGGVNIALATGNWVKFCGQNLREHGVMMTINGVPGGTGTGSRALGDPLNVLCWLVNHLSNRRVGLRAGEIVATGTCTGLDPVRPGDVVHADFGMLGTVVIEFERNN
ncbi:2-keto-4-pentenoate hydratase [Pelagibius sp. Alg239-R121]|uniref:2-keto-4-pentenoate hydratase n=1 Tax=Pelagibius sp. Alg239-R121 TaxID=2993448 RepID=UPI0024A74AF6|nr:fumarylacetoacetate hydrolase family protein [Pelagibius sp. Alg239-R121]